MNLIPDTTRLRARSLLLPPLLSLLPLISSAAQDFPLQKTQRCGAATVKAVRTADQTQRLTLRTPKGQPVSVRDAVTTLEWCRDAAHLGVPQAMLSGFSGGAHCCTTISLYTAEARPRLLLKVATGNAGAPQPVQLAGDGPLQLRGYDDRLAYAYGLCYACSPSLPRLWSYDPRVRQYVIDTRRFPGVISSDLPLRPGATEPADALMSVARLLLLGQANGLPAYLATLAPPLRSWLDSYLPDMQQDLSNFGLSDWPVRAGVDRSSLLTAGLGGSFSAPGRTELLSIVRGQDGPAAHLYMSADGVNVMDSGPLLPLPGALNLYAEGDSGPAAGSSLDFVVMRASGRSQVVVGDTRAGQPRYATYAVNATGMTRLAPADDALARFALLLGHLTRLAETQARTGEKGTSVQAAARQAQRDAQPDVNSGPQSFQATALQHFTANAITMEADGAEQARMSATLTLSSGVSSSVRQRLTATLSRTAGAWTVTAWTLTPLVSAPSAP